VNDRPSYLRCVRCGTLISWHFDDRKHWVGCPEDALIAPKPCAYQDCRDTEIENIPLHLCAKHAKIKPHVTPGRTSPVNQ
jgi:hypothetical protein